MFRRFLIYSYIGFVFGFLFTISFLLVVTDLSVSLELNLQSLPSTFYIYHYQTLITGLLAIIGAVGTIWIIYQQIVSSNKQHKELIARDRFNVVLREVETELSEYTRKIGQIGAIKLLGKSLDKGATPDNNPDDLGMFVANYSEKKNRQRWELFRSGYTSVFADRLFEALDHSPKRNAQLNSIPNEYIGSPDNITIKSKMISYCVIKNEENYFMQQRYVDTLVKCRKDFLRICERYVDCYDRNKERLEQLHPESFERFNETTFKLLHDKLEEIVAEQRNRKEPKINIISS